VVRIPLQQGESHKECFRPSLPFGPTSPFQFPSNLYDDPLAELTVCYESAWGIVDEEIFTKALRPLSLFLNQSHRTLHSLSLNPYTKDSLSICAHCSSIRMADDNHSYAVDAATTGSHWAVILGACCVVQNEHPCDWNAQPGRA
jgi:hypothetical protein